MNIAIIQENQQKFFRLEEQIRHRTRTVKKIYSCRYPSEFFELSRWQSCQLIIAENEIRGRTDAGLNFFQEFYKKTQTKPAHGLLYTWGTDDYNSLRIQSHALHHKQPCFLGMIFEQIGDYEKILDVIRAIQQKKAYPIFDRPLQHSTQNDIQHEQRRKELEKLMELRFRIEERLQFFVQLLRHHLEYRTGIDFRHTLREFSGYRENLPARWRELSQDVSELLSLIETSQFLREAVEMHALQQELRALADMLKKNHSALPQLHQLKPFIDFCFASTEPRPQKGHRNGSFYIWKDFLKEYDGLFYMVSHVIETAQVVIKTARIQNQPNHAYGFN